MHQSLSYTLQNDHYGLFPFPLLVGSIGFPVDGLRDGVPVDGLRDGLPVDDLRDGDDVGQVRGARNAVSAAGPPVTLTHPMAPLSS